MRKKRREHPAGESKCGQSVHHRHIERGRLIGQAHEAGARLFTGLNKARDLGHSRLIGARCSAHDKRLRKIDRAGRDARARPSRLRQGFSSQHREIEIRNALLDHAVHRRAFTRRQQQAITGNDVTRGDRFGVSVSVEARCGRCLQREQLPRRRARPLAQTMIKIAPDQQEKEQHRDAVEIGVLPLLQRLGDARAKRQKDGQRNRHVHIGAPRTQRTIRRLEEVLRRIERGRNCNQRRHPVQQRARAFAHFVRTGPNRHREHHDVHRGKAGHGEIAQQAPALLVDGGLRHLRIERSCAVAERRQLLDDAFGRRAARAPTDPQSLSGKIEARLLDARHLLQALLNL